MSDDPMVAQAEATTKVSSALTPALILAGSSLAGGLAGIRLGPEEYHDIFSWLMIGGPLLAAAQIAFFTIFDRDRLHSERHLERKLLISRTKPTLGDSITTIELDADQDLIENPSLGGDS